MSAERASKVVWTAIIVTDCGCMLVRKRGPGFDAGKWGPPGGHVEIDESETVCAERELREETGLLTKIHASQLRAIISEPRGVICFYEVNRHDVVNWHVLPPIRNEQGHGSWCWLTQEQIIALDDLQSGLAAFFAIPQADSTVLARFDADGHAVTP